MSDVIQTEHRKQAEEEFRRLRDVLPQYMSADATPLYANDNLLQFLGVTLDDFRAQDFQVRAFHPVHGFATPQEANWSRSSFCSVTFPFRQPNDISVANSAFKVPSTTKSE
jgi:hypothetical protein